MNRVVLFVLAELRLPPDRDGYGRECRAGRQRSLRVVCDERMLSTFPTKEATIAGGAVEEGAYSGRSSGHQTPLTPDSPTVHACRDEIPRPRTRNLPGTRRCMQRLWKRPSEIRILFIEGAIVRGVANGAGAWDMVGVGMFLRFMAPSGCIILAY